ncbi:MAG: HEAT repeat domain-containing protein [Sumerlaeia bacterium]
MSDQTTLNDLLRLASGPNPARSYRALRDLAEHAQSPGGLQFLREALEDKERNIRWAAARALGMAGDAAIPAYDQLKALLRDPYQPIQWAAAHALRDLGRASPGRVVPRLIDALSDPEDNVRWGAARALGEIGPMARDAVATLSGMENDKAGWVQWVAQWALFRIDEAQ